MNYLPLGNRLYLGFLFQEIRKKGLTKLNFTF
jgi:hypothetical protein